MFGILECIESPSRAPEFASRAGVLPLGVCSGHCPRSERRVAPLRVDPLAFALRGEFYRYLCRECEADLEMEA
jgi:hypothetical protein